jgi:hypothetical protein
LRSSSGPRSGIDDTRPITPLGDRIRVDAEAEITRLTAGPGCSSRSGYTLINVGDRAVRPPLRLWLAAGAARRGENRGGGSKGGVGVALNGPGSI